MNEQIIFRGKRNGHQDGGDVKTRRSTRLIIVGSIALLLVLLVVVAWLSDWLVDWLWMKR
jgi:hypothetical protein